MTTLAPAATRRSAMARPMPRLPPEITATLPASSPVPVVAGSSVLCIVMFPLGMSGSIAAASGDEGWRLSTAKSLAVGDTLQLDGGEGVDGAERAVGLRLHHVEWSVHVVVLVVVDRAAGTAGGDGRPALQCSDTVSVRGDRLGPVGRQRNRLDNVRTCRAVGLIHGQAEAHHPVVGVVRTGQGRVGVQLRVVLVEGVASWAGRRAADRGDQVLAGKAGGDRLDEVAARRQVAADERY